MGESEIMGEGIERAWEIEHERAWEREHGR